MKTVHETTKGFAIRCGKGYRGANGEVRHVVMIHKCNGYRVSWDSAPYGPDYWRIVGDLPRDRPKGLMAMRKFQAWAQEQVTE